MRSLRARYHLFQAACLVFFLSLETLRLYMAAIFLSSALIAWACFIRNA